MLLTFLLAAVLWSCNCWWNAANIYTFAVQPGYLDFDNLPDTNFSCDGKVIGGYYADVETGCQMFHVCTIGQKAEITDIKFLCLNGTVFDQETRVCERLDEVDCSKSESFFDLNLELYGNNGAGYGIAPEEPLEQEPVQCNADEEDCSGTPDYFDEEVTTIPGPVVLASTVATTSSTTTSTTARTTTAPTTTTTTTTSTTAPSTRKPLSAIAMLSTAKPTPPAVSYPTNSPETIAALIALHNAFQDSLKEREQGPGPKGQHMHRYQSPRPPQQQPSPKPFTVANFQPPRHFPSKAPQPPPPPYRHQQQHQQPQHPVLLSSERFGNQNFRHGFRLQNGPSAPPPVEESPPSFQQQQQQQHQQQQQQQQHHQQQQQHEQQHQQQQQQEQEQQQYNLDGGAQYDGNYDDDGGGIAAVSDDVDVNDEESRRNFAREAPEASVSVSVQVSSSSSKNSVIDQQQQRPAQVAVTTASSSTATAATTATTTTTTTTMATTTTEESVTADRDGAARPFTAKPGASPTPRPEQPQGPPPVDDVDSGDLYEDEYEELEGDEEFFKDVPKLGRNRKRRYVVVGRGWRA